MRVLSRRRWRWARVLVAVASTVASGAGPVGRGDGGVEHGSCRGDGGVGRGSCCTPAGGGATVASPRAGGIKKLWKKSMSANHSQTIDVVDRTWTKLCLYSGSGSTRTVHLPSSTRALCRHLVTLCRVASSWNLSASSWNLRLASSWSLCASRWHL